MSRSLVATVRIAPRAASNVPLTSLVDMMTILLVFLLCSFSVDGQIVTPSADLELPPSSSEVPARPAVNVEVTTAGVNYDGRQVATLADLTGDDLRIDALHAALTASGEAPVAISIHCDRRLDFRVLKCVLRTCHEAGCDDLSLLVLQEES
jgi:biopolymer transport protein ExbD